MVRPRTVPSVLFGSADLQEDCTKVWAPTDEYNKLAPFGQAPPNFKVVSGSDFLAGAELLLDVPDATVTSPLVEKVLGDFRRKVAVGLFG